MECQLVKDFCSLRAESANKTAINSINGREAMLLRAT
jgi:hypothetical protein